LPIDQYDRYFKIVHILAINIWAIISIQQQIYKDNFIAFVSGLGIGTGIILSGIQMYMNNLSSIIYD
jgi:hypothetical protein